MHFIENEISHQFAVSGSHMLYSQMREKEKQMCEAFTSDYIYFIIVIVYELYIFVCVK